MNTDNMTLTGATFDYGPFGFMDRFNPDFTPNHTDGHGRYAFGRQAEIGHWNLAKLGETLIHLITAGSHHRRIGTIPADVQSILQ